MSSYVFQFFCGPECIALANPGGARARPALAAPPPRARVEFISEEPVQPAARLRPRSEDRERPRSPSRHRRGRDRRGHRRRARTPRRRSTSGHRRRHRSRTPHQPATRGPTASQPAARRPIASLLQGRDLLDNGCLNRRNQEHARVYSSRHLYSGPQPHVPPGTFHASSGSAAVPLRTSAAGLLSSGNAGIPTSKRGRQLDLPDILNPKLLLPVSLNPQFKGRQARSFVLIA